MGATEDVGGAKVHQMRPTGLEPGGEESRGQRQVCKSGIAQGGVTENGVRPRSIRRGGVSAWVTCLAALAGEDACRELAWGNEIDERICLK